MVIGMFVGVALGLAGIFYFALDSTLEQVAFVGICLMSFQLFGATVGAAVGKKSLD